MRTMATVWLTASVFVLVGAGCSGFGPRVSIEDTQQLTIPAGALERLTVATHNGTLEVAGQADRDEIAVTVTRKASGLDTKDARACLDAIVIVSESSDGKTHQLGWKWAGVRRNGWGASVSFDVQMPAGLALRAKTHNGRLDAKGLAADCDLETHNGHLTVASLAGNVSATSHNQGIVATTAGKRVTLECQNGRVRLTATGAEVLHLLSHNGGIDADLSGSPTPSGRLKSHNGSLHVKLARDTSATLACRTHNGSVKSSVPWTVHEQSRRHVRGTLGDGEANLALETHNGSIRLTKGE